MNEAIQLIERITGNVRQDINSHPMTFILDAQHLLVVAKELHQNATTYFDQLSCITGIDNGPQVNTMEVIYTLYSIPFHQSLMLKIILPRENPEVETVSTIWKSADWLEREVYDMFGIHFKTIPT